MRKPLSAGKTSIDLRNSAPVRGDSGDVVEILRVALSAEALDLEATPIRLDGGRSAELFHFRLSAGPEPLVGDDLVLRLLPSQSGWRDECVIQDGVAQLGFPAPAVIRWGASNGRSYMIMKFVDGASLFDCQGPLRSLRVVPETLATLMAALHSLDVAPICEALTSLETTAALDGRARALRDVEACFEAVGSPARTDLHRWFETHQPPPTHPVVCHGDLHAFNVLVNGGTSVLDWELAAIGDPESDVARTKLLLRAVPMELPRAARPIVERLGQRTAARFEDAYRSTLPLRSDAIR